MPETARVICLHSTSGDSQLECLLQPQLYNVSSEVNGLSFPTHSSPPTVFPEQKIIKRGFERKGTGNPTGPDVLWVQC